MIVAVIVCRSWSGCCLLPLERYRAAVAFLDSKQIDLPYVPGPIASDSIFSYLRVLIHSPCSLMPITGEGRDLLMFMPLKMPLSLGNGPDLCASPSWRYLFFASAVHELRVNCIFQELGDLTCIFDLEFVIQEDF